MSGADSRLVPKWALPPLSPRLPPVRTDANSTDSSAASDPTASRRTGSRRTGTAELGDDGDGASHCTIAACTPSLPSNRQLSAESARRERGACKPVGIAIIARCNSTVAGCSLGGGTGAVAADVAGNSASEAAVPESSRASAAAAGDGGGGGGGVTRIHSRPRFSSPVGVTLTKWSRSASPGTAPTSTLGDSAGVSSDAPDADDAREKGLRNPTAVRAGDGSVASSTEDTNAGGSAKVRTSTLGASARLGASD